MSITMPGPWKHPTTSTLYLKQRVPADVAAIAKGIILYIPVDGTPYPVKVGDQVKVSLRTKEIATAKSRYREADDAVQMQWQRLRSDVVDLSHKQTLALAGEVARATVKSFEEDPGPPEAWRELLRLNVTFDAGADYVETLERQIGPTLDPLLTSRGLIVSQRSRETLLHRSHVALTEAASDLLRNAGGDYSPSDTLTRYPNWAEPAKPPAAKPGTNSQRQTISGLFELWRADRAKMGGAESSAKRWAGPVASFVKFLGHDDAASVQSADVIRWRMALLEGGTPPATFVRVHSAAVKAVFSFGVSNLLLSSNPVLGVRFKAPKETKTRPDGFTSDEATAILRATLYAPSAPGGTGEVLRRAFRWVP